MLINASNAQTTFTNISYFYLCQIALNNELPDDKIVEMWTATAQAASKIGVDGTIASTLQAPNGEHDNPHTASQVPAPGNSAQDSVGGGVEVANP